jgi:hypothetical protein
VPDASVGAARNPTPPLCGTSNVTVMLGGKHRAVSVTAVPSGPEDGVSVSDGPDRQPELSVEEVVAVVTGTVVTGTVATGALVVGAVAVVGTAAVVGAVAVVGAADVAVADARVVGVLVRGVVDEEPPVTTVQSVVVGAGAVVCVAEPVADPEGVGSDSAVMVVVSLWSAVLAAVGGTVISGSDEDVGLVDVPGGADGTVVVVASGAGCAVVAVD